MSYLVVFRALPDVDHMAPIAWRLLESGETVHAVTAPGFDPSGDYRLRFLAGYDRFHLHPWRSPLDSLLPWAFGFLLRHKVRVVLVEWGHGPIDAYERPWNLRGLLALGKDLLVSLRNSWRHETSQPRTSFVIAAWFLRRPTVCLPHGLNVKLTAITTAEAEKLMANGGYRWTDRNRFSHYVLNTEHHRQWHIDYALGDPDVMETWGSVRWSPEWFEQNRRIAPPWAWPAGAEGKVKVAFMVPKWKKKVNAEAVLGLVKRLQSLDGVSLAIKGHPRPEDGTADPLRDDPEIDWSRIHDVTPVDSVSLIREADAVIDVGSSIGIETVMAERALINPQYLHEIRTLFDEIPDVCFVCRNHEDVEEALAILRPGEGHRVPPEAFRELMRRAVYGSSDEPFDVLETYHRRITALGRPDTEPRGIRPRPQARS